MVKRWDTRRIAAWGAIAGALYDMLLRFWEGLPAVFTAELVVYFLSEMAGGALGGAILLALASGLRNLILRAK